MNLGAETPGGDRLKGLIDEASNVFVSPSTKAAHYIRSGNELLRSANNYAQDGQLDHALVLYTRYLTIFLERLRSHPGFKELPSADKKLVQANCSKILPKAEALREALRKQFDEEHEAYLLNIEQTRGPVVVVPSKEQDKNKDGDDVWNNPFRNDLQFQPSAPPPNEGSSPISTNNFVGKETTSAYSDIIADLHVEESRPGALPGGVGSGPIFDRNTKPTRFLSPMNSGLRQVVVPGDLVVSFLKCADKNTEANVETCGFLTGRILQGRLVITDLIIPKQDGTSDSCTAKGDEEYLVVQDRLDLITFGWIHTHPSQTAFLSSVDMHSQYCYQQMMPEAIAIVCAPRKDQVGIFTLNPAEGMEIIGSCPHTSGFHTHPHSSVPLFIDATHHVFDRSRNVTIHDLRYT